MNSILTPSVYSTTYNRSSCQIGVVHLGFGAFHRAHQAVFIDDYMQESGDLDWGIAAVNLRPTETEQFGAAQSDVDQHQGYFLQTYSGQGDIALRKVRSHVRFADWSLDQLDAENLIALSSVHWVTITVTESGYYSNSSNDLELDDPLIQAEINGAAKRSVYAYLRAALTLRMTSGGGSLTISCCDNIRQNGKMLQRNLLAYLAACNDDSLRGWIETNVAFPCSMVDRITPRSPLELSNDLSQAIGVSITSPIMAEDFSQWVLERCSPSSMPNLGSVGVIVTEDVDPYEETKIRVLNGGHTALAYMAALEGIETFDQAMANRHLREHFNRFEQDEVLPALPDDLPFSKQSYLDKVTARFGNTAIGDTVARICADGCAKFPLFIQPTIEACYRQGTTPIYAIRSTASWYVFARHVVAGNIGFTYIEPSWDKLSGLLGKPDFTTDASLWGDLPQNYPDFSHTLQQEIIGMEQKWPV